MKSPHDEQVFPNVRVMNVESRKIEAAMTQIPADFPVIREFKDGARERFVRDCIHRHSVWKSSYFSGQPANLREMPAFRLDPTPERD